MQVRSSKPGPPVELAKDWSAQLRSNGLRATTASTAVLRGLDGSDQPLTHAELGSVVERIGGQPVERVTLYRVLERLTAVGLVMRYPGPDGTARFGMADPDAIGHFECNGCHRIIELSRSVVPPKVLEHLARQLQGQGIASGELSLAITGTCSQCSAAGHAGPMVVMARPKG